MKNGNIAKLRTKVIFDEPELAEAWEKVMISTKKNKTKFKY